MPCFRLILLKECVIQILQKRHLLRSRIFKILLIDLMDTSVDDRLLNRLQALLATYDKLTQRQNKICLKSYRVIIIRIIHVDIHRIDVLRTGRCDLDDLTTKPFNQRRILCLRIRDDHIVIRYQECICNLPLRGKRFTGTGSTEDQTVRVLKQLPVYHDQVIGKCIQSVIETLIS